MWRQLWHVLERSDVIVQLVDARHPLLFYSMDLAAYATELGKQHAVLVNKADLITAAQRQAWLHYFKQQQLHVWFWSAVTQQDIDADTHTGGDDVVDECAILTCEQLISAFKQCCTTQQSTTVGLVGYPNVGKSSTINCLLGQKKVTTVCLFVFTVCIILFNIVH